MKLEHLGDALDYFKGSIISELLKSNALVDLQVDPMITDEKIWSKNSFEVYERLLYVKPVQVLHDHWMTIDRRAYFTREQLATGDLFLDPDTGMEPQKSRAARCHLKCSELLSTLNINKRRVVLVYQHSRRMTLRQTVFDVMSQIHVVDTAINWASYEGTTVAMLFFSFSASRIRQIKSILEWIDDRKEGPVRLHSD